jgi:hypothetical protein
MSERHVPGSTEIMIRGSRIREDANGLVCLDDIWAAAKSTPGREPRRWRDVGATRRLEIELQKKIVTAALKDNTVAIPVAYAKRGRGNAGTWAHPILAAAYAGYLSPKLEIEVREVWLRYRAADAALADEILQRAPPADNEWAAVRALARAKRVGYTDMLRDHGVDAKGYQCVRMPSIGKFSAVPPNRSAGVAALYVAQTCGTILALMNYRLSWPQKC